MPLIQETIPSHLRGRGVGTLVEPAKNEPCETACRMAEGESTRVFKITTSLRVGYFILCSACFSRNDMHLVKEKSPSPLLKGEGRGEGLFTMSLRTGTMSFVGQIKNSR